MCFLVIGLTGASYAVAQQLYYDGSMQVATGSYFFEGVTQSFYLNNGLSISHSDYSASITFPFIVQNSPWISYGSTGGIPTGGPQNESVRHHNGPRQDMEGQRRHINLTDTVSYAQSGFGDPSLSLGYKLYGSDLNKTTLYINTSVKFPFADPKKGFGTGAWDMGFGSSISRRLGSWFLSANVMYWYFGDMADLEIKNSLNYGAGIGKSFPGGDWMILGSFNGMTEVVDGIDPPMSAGLGVGYQVGERTRLTINTYFGLSESSSDIMIGAGWQINLWKKSATRAYQVLTAIDDTAYE